MSYDKLRKRLHHMLWVASSQEDWCTHGLFMNELVLLDHEYCKNLEINHLPSATIN